MQDDLNKQYNSIAKKFSANHTFGKNSNDKNRLHFYSFLDAAFIRGKNLLDVACGDGLDANLYLKLGAKVFGVDASEEMVRIAKEKYRGIEFTVGFAENLPYSKESFDIVTSKYAVMTSADIQPIFNEVHRVLKPGGIFVYLTTHPMRQYFERRSNAADYFSQEIVTSNIFNNTVSLQEPTHTFNEYFSSNFFEKFNILRYEEAFDPAAENIDGRIYPGYFIVVCQKK
jgi:ubiquinone/menaquinone biosynthesis C-methylase UbiE